MDLRTALQQTGALGRASRVRESDRFNFEGGLNLEDAPMDIPPGQCLGAKNYEPGVRKGIRRTKGYERLDGRTSPTRGTFIAIDFDGGAGFAPAEGATVTESGSGATGIVAYLKATDANTGWVVLVNTSGTFTGGATLTSGIQTTTGGTAYTNDASTTALREEFTLNKADYLRSLITKVGASAGCTGAVRGCTTFLGVKYAFRDNAAGTAGTMWKSSAAGWVQVSLGFKVYFNGSVGEIFEGDTVTGATSAATAVVRRIVLTDGVWSTAGSGYFICTAITGAFIAAENLQVTAVTKALFVSSAAQTLAPAGRYYFRQRNFSGAADKFRLYGVNGVNKAFEFDGTYFVLIDTGMTVDTPERIFEQNDHLGLVFPGGSVQHSGFQTPLNFHPILGADERSIGADVVDVLELNDNTTLIATRQKKYAFYGDVVENFQLKPLPGDCGLLPNTVADLGQTLFLDDTGFSTVKASSTYGNFQLASISDKIQTYLTEKLGAVGIVGQVVNYRLNIYRLLFTDGTGLSIAVRPGNRFSGWMPIVYAHTPSCFASDEIEDGTSIYKLAVLMGTSDGYVMELDVGRSFDGEDIEAFARLHYHHSGSPERYKHYRRAQIDIRTDGPCEVLGCVDYNYGARDGQTDDPLALTGGGGFWDVGEWSEFLWSQPAFEQIVMKLEGNGFNIGFVFYSKANDHESHTLFGVSLQNSMRRLNRGTQEG